MILGPGTPCPLCGWKTTRKDCRAKARRSWSRHLHLVHATPLPIAEATAEASIPRRTR